MFECKHIFIYMFTFKHGSTPHPNLQKEVFSSKMVMSIALHRYAHFIQTMILRGLINLPQCYLLCFD